VLIAGTLPVVAEGARDLVQEPSVSGDDRPERSPVPRRGEDAHVLPRDLEEA
jgi:hypothetical protein